ncbi:hypothetical protein [Bacillus sp. UNCCL81]|uniref:hypothetical protein n=1 Tax=Bacillus sp. UNCCL81 TaxID=1502755 RepID=UPI0008EB4ED2|nr:hypothetical protein [Bacillus sp. UNCCL81]SFC42097.1 hypothetical protein SAMN02799633_00750 [Bacillus sp. UNCCL81]
MDNRDSYIQFIEHIKHKQTFSIENFIDEMVKKGFIESEHSLEITKLYKDEKSITIDDLTEFGLTHTILIDYYLVKQDWDQLISEINTVKQTAYIRGYGRDSKNTHKFEKFYREVFGITVKKDGTNNDKPKRRIAKRFKDQSQDKLLNYQVSHVFERTKNPYAFLALWNVTYVPKLIDPLTGHESEKEDYKTKFENEWKMMIYNKYSDLIEEFNKKMEEKREDIDKYLVQWKKEQLIEVTGDLFYIKDSLDFMEQHRKCHINLIKHDRSYRHCIEELRLLKSSESRKTEIKKIDSKIKKVAKEIDGKIRQVNKDVDKVNKKLKRLEDKILNDINSFIDDVNKEVKQIKPGDW